MRLIFTVCSFFCAVVGQAQLQDFNAVNSTVGSGGVVQFNNFAELGQKSTYKLDYSDVRGNCFWDKDWNQAILLLSSNKAVKLSRVKLNFYTNEVHYIDNTGKELIAQNGIKKIIFYDRKDTSKVAAVFQFLFGFKIGNVDSYAQVLNDGKIQLLKRTEVILVKKDFDQMAGKSELKFISEFHYYISEKQNVSPLKNINKTNLFSIIKLLKEDEAWLKENKNKLKNEAQVISFLVHRNLMSE